MLRSIIQTLLYSRFFGQNFIRMATVCENTVSTKLVTELDREFFKKTLNLIAIKVSAKLCSTISSKYKMHLFQRPRMRRVYDIDNEPEKKLILLSEQFSDLSLSQIPIEMRDYLNGIRADVLEYKLDLTYNHLNADEILTQILPSGIEIPSSYEQVGHVAHLNLRDSLILFKNIIGRVLLDKNPVLRTVVNKVGTIETEYRTFPMEVIAGDNDLNVTVKESNARFSFNFEEVYWNSRLQTEHARLIQIISKRNLDSKLIVADMMSGVGPFSIPLAMNNVTVHANDLNPASFKYLVANTKLNKCEKFIKCYCLDGREFILSMADRNIKIDEAIMNLPASATDFLDVFIGYAKRYKEHISDDSLPRVHAYAFSVENDPIIDIIKRVAGVLRCDSGLIRIDTFERRSLRASKKRKRIECPLAQNSNDIETGKHSDASVVEDIQEIKMDTTILSGIGHIVRDVAPQKVMVCLSFQLPSQVAYADPIVIRRYES